MYVPPSPGLPIGALIRGSTNPKLPPPLANQNVLLYSKARHALYAAVDALGLKPGETILLPAYLFQSVAEPFRLRGLKLAFYRIDRSFMCDLDELKERLSSTGARAVVLIHYFGFPQPVAEVRKLTEPREVFVIEDCAHALLSEVNGQLLGTDGDVGIYCLHKSLGLPDGGALVPNAASLQTPRAPSGINRWGLIFNLIKKGSARLESRLGWSWRTLLLRSSKMRHRAYYLEGMLGIHHNRAIAPLSHRLMQALPYDEIRKRRRRNFDWYRRSLKDMPEYVQPMGDLKEGVCPFGYPLLVERRDALIHWLLRQGVNCQVLWEVLDPEIPLDDFPDSEYLRRHNLILPLHQDIGQRECQRVVSALRRWVENPES